LVLLGDRHHEPQVRLHERPFGDLAFPLRAAQLALAGGGETLGRAVELLPGRLAALDQLRQADFVILGEQWVLADIRVR
jgi:hypothetical protein